MTTTFARLASIAVALLVPVAGLVPAEGQQLSVVRPGSFEIDPFLGVSYGIDQTRFMGGGNVSFAVDKYILPYVEYSYFPGIGRTDSGSLPNGAPFTYHHSIPMSDFHGGVHIRIPIRESHVVPYGSFGVGGLSYSSYSENVSYSTSNGQQTFMFPVQGATNFAVNFGGGLRFYLTPRYGFRVEAKAYKPTGTFTEVFGKAEVGFFIQLR